MEENIYQIERPEMNVPAKVYASEKLLETIKDDNTLEQACNMAKLPGVEKHVCVMPDGHQGYGFPIGGVAAFDAEKGLISPGGIGFDINCLSAESDILLEFGRKKRITELEENFAGERAIVAGHKAVESDIVLFTETENQEVHEVVTETGEEIKATEDHPFLTDQGMKELEEINEGEQVYIQPFEGIMDEEPQEFTILEREDFQNESNQLIQALEDRDLLPLKSTDEEFNILLKLIGFHTGDGSFNNNGETSFYAETEDLEKIAEDIQKLGFKPSRIYERERTHQVRAEPFTRTEKMVKSTSQAFQKLMIKLGAPKGKKTAQEFSVPEYIQKLADWQKALYLSTFFGAEMSSPKAQHGKDFYCPKISQNKSKKIEGSGRKFMEDISEMLEDLGVETNKIEAFDTHENQDGEVIRHRLGISNDLENLLSFYTRIGYRYNLEKRKKSVKVVQYLKTKKQAIQKRKEISEQAEKLYNNGEQPKEIKQKFDINNRFIERSMYSGRKTRPRPPNNFPSFEEFAENLEVKENLTVKTTVKKIREKGREKVYDIGVKHEAHNFNANQFIVSNCGVRVLKTGLKAEDLEGMEEQLANIMYSKVPVGLGQGGYIDIDEDDLEEVLEKGMDWMLENNHASERDLDRCEENGRLPGKAGKVPEKAKSRGLDQLGSLGSGNHFLEVQVVDEVFSESKAKAYGLEKDQVIVMIHSGSRGLGHQVCTEYVREFEKSFPEVAEEIDEKNLIYAPIDSQEAQDYKEAMYAAANFAWCNRQAITEAIRECLDTLFDHQGVEMLYDVCHNIAKEETHEIDGKEKEVIVHRKGATRAFPPGHEKVPEAYRESGQPVLIPGTMGTSSYILSGGENSMDLSFGSTAHGAGRLKSRSQSKQDYWGEDVQQDLKREGIHIKAASGSTIAEEAPGSYKDVDEVIKVSDSLGIGEKVVKMRPVVNIKG